MQLKLKPYQEDNIRILSQYLIDRGGAFLVEGPGTGKTVQGIEISNTLRNKGLIDRVLVISQAKIINQGSWQKEFQRCPDINVMIVAYTSLHKLDREWLEGKGVLLILDESHECKNPTSQRSKSIHKLNQNPAIKYKLAMSATPITQSPEDLYGMLKCVLSDDLREHLGCRWMGEFKGTYLRYREKEVYTPKRVRKVKELIGVKDAYKDLVKNLRDNYGIARRTEMIEGDLPSREVTEIKVSVPVSEETKRVMDEVFEALNVEDPTDKEIEGIRLTYASTRKIVGLSKVKVALPHVLKIMEEKKGQMIVFSYHIETAERVHKTLIAAGVNACLATGTVRPKERAKRINEFKEGKYDVLSATISSCGTGLNLDEANITIFLEESFNQAEMEQARGRIFRLSQKKKTFYYYIRDTDNHIDERIKDLLTLKEKIIKMFYE